ncbi:Protein of unknown function [Gracilibacillus ureilyticus]|uniref:Spore germination protein PE n=2 Tax=Gracilibacillus ureilyticus TaxID=531814 RepID=A0A1H9SM59_9BACI|nr:Protein of unknown function [Gracilibacillus ureilyticus]
MEPKLDALAVQKEGGISSDKGFELEKYPIFQSEGHFLPINMQIEQHHTHHCPVIDVPVIEISAISSSAIVNLGNVKNVKSKSRIKHIRILKDEENTMEV